jgi:hypothetical protein
MIKERVKTVHDNLRGAHIEPAWMIGKKPDKDGRVTLGKMKKAGELDRELHGYDAILIVNAEHWKILNEQQRLALIDHELCHLDVALDPTSLEPKVDGHGKTCYRVRKHDLEEFRGVIERHGVYLSDIAEFVRAAMKKDPNMKLFPDKDEADFRGPTRLPKKDQADAPAAN